MKPNTYLTAAQQELLALLQPKEVPAYYESLKTIHYLATYCVGTELVELTASRNVHDLMDAIQRLAMEQHP